jgi:hypothetical protein
VWGSPQRNPQKRLGERGGAGIPQAGPGIPRSPDVWGKGVGTLPPSGTSARFLYSGQRVLMHKPERSGDPKFFLEGPCRVAIVQRDCHTLPHHILRACSCGR